MSRLYIDFYQDVSFFETNQEHLGNFTPKSFRSNLLRDFDPNYRLSKSKKIQSYKVEYSEIEDFIADLANLGLEFKKIYYESTVSLIRNHHPSTNHFGPFLEFVILCREVLGQYNCNLFEEIHSHKIYRADLDADYNLKIYHDLQAFYSLSFELNRVNQGIYLKLLNGFEISSQNGLTIFTYYQNK